ncbi:hypothetical protein [Thalassomonas actiniarum]|uniref:ATP-grasp domain-containing protein n=1 Tax=Thalassomonas actiniarum TaxID=485447 RepID=A0AAE9YUT2_9GAMM|nr:hypothetical protein [Thalassomonas actiniarum]WDE01631.1 hypothetical protein SG35_014000 [Thalassomonas actiniarum]
MHIVIYKWRTREDFLLPRLFPEAEIIEAEPRVDDCRIIAKAREIASAHPQQNLYWFFQINLSYWRLWLTHHKETVESLTELGFTVINSEVTDIRKRTIQSLNRQLGLVDVEIDHLEPDQGKMPVMVKSNYNYGGEFEASLPSDLMVALGVEDINDCQIKGFDSYFKTRLADVEQALWQDEGVMIERYIENKERKFFRFYRCGNHSVLSMIINGNLIKKMLPGLPRKNWFLKFQHSKNHAYQNLIDNASLMLEAMGMGFGAVDMVMDNDHKAYIIDVNPTPGWGAEKQDEVIAFLRQGL